MQGTMTRRFKVILISTTTVIAVIVATLPYFVSRIPLAIALPVSVTIALFGVVFALTSGSTRVVLLILILGADIAALVYFVPGIRATAVTFLSTEIDPRSTPIVIAVLTMASIALFAVLVARTHWDVRVILAITLIPAVVVALLVFVPGIRAAAATSLSAIFSLRGPPLAIAVLASAMVALFGVIFAVWGGKATRMAGITVLVVALIYLIPNLLTGSFSLIIAILAAVTDLASAILAWFNGLPGAIATVAAAIIALIGVLITQIVTMIIQIATIRKAGRDQTHEQASLALEQAQNEALRAYIDQMSDLMIDQQLGRAGKDKHSLEDQVRNVAQARTIAIFMGLDGRHKRRPLKLIYELGLINREDNILDLKNAGLDHADFSECSLRRAHLRGADLRVSDLSGADLRESDLTEADLRGADLRRANLSNTVLTNANLLPYDERDPERLSPPRLARTNLSNEPLSPRKLTWRDSRIIITKGREHWWPTVTELTVTNLSHAVLVYAQLEGALLGGSNLFHADLREANLTKANLLQANLKEADLSGAVLSGVNLSGTDLTNAQVTKEQLKESESLKGATMPNGQKYEDWLKDQEDRGKD